MEHSNVFFPEANSPHPICEEARGPLLPEDLPKRADLAAPGVEPTQSSEVMHLTRAEFFNELLKLRDDERERIGHELHDSAGQLLLYLQLSVARLKLIEGAGPHDELIEEIQSTTRQIASEIRSLAFLTHPRQLSPDGLSSALQMLVGGFGKRTGLQASFKSVGDVSTINEDTSLALLRVAQEALVNVHRHAHASSVTMRLIAREGSIELTIRDDGRGMPSSDDLAAASGVGVEGMRFRLEQLGGQFRIDSSHRGTTIFAKVPLRHAVQRQTNLGLDQLVAHGVSDQVRRRP